MSTYSDTIHFKKIKFFFLVILLIHSTLLLGQSELKVYARLHSVKINEDLYEPKKVETNIFFLKGISDIIEFANIDSLRFGIKIEIHESHMDPEVRHIVRRNLYMKYAFDKDWIKINSAINIYKILSRDEVVDFTERDLRGNHDSATETTKIEGGFYNFKIVYDCVYQWK